MSRAGELPACDRPAYRQPDPRSRLAGADYSMNAGADAFGALRRIHRPEKVRRACRDRKGRGGRGNRRCHPAGQRQMRSRYAIARADGFGFNLAVLRRCAAWMSLGPPSAICSVPLCMAAPLPSLRTLAPGMSASHLRSGHRMSPCRRLFPLFRVSQSGRLKIPVTGSGRWLVQRNGPPSIVPERMTADCHVAPAATRPGVPVEPRS